MFGMSFFVDPLRWYDLNFGEDVMMGVYCAAAGLQMLDRSDVGQVFGIQARQLAYSPKELLDRGHSIVHSVKNDDRYPEFEVRNFFRRLRHSM
jgi:hypothetical protein